MTSDEERRLRSFWAEYLGCSTEQLQDEGCYVVSHGSGLQEYHGAWVCDVGSRVVSVPIDRLSHLSLRCNALAGAQPLTEASLAEFFGPITDVVVGPVYVGYLSAAAALQTDGKHRRIALDDAREIERLRRHFKRDWATSGLDDCAVRFGVFDGRRLIAVAGYDVWGSAIAHLGVFTEPAVRRRGYAAALSSTAAMHARNAGLIPQWRTLFDNLPSMKIALDLGFERFMRYFAVRFR